MVIWQPDPGEAYLCRGPIMFASGAATSVSGMRWFRDDRRNDIQHELPGWPEGPDYAVRSKHDRLMRSGVRGVLGTLGFAIVAVLGVGSVSTRGRPEDPANEVDDFPVMWGASGTVARTLPWQLDLARRAHDQRTHLIVTDRRLVIVGMRNADVVEDDEVLWETDSENVAKVELKNFSAMQCKDFYATQCDFRIDFVDGSWCRLASNYRDKFRCYMTYPLTVIDPEDLSPGQRKRLESFTADRELVGEPVVMRRPSGNFLMDIRPAMDVSVFSGMFVESDRMGPNGEDVVYQDGDL